MGVQGLIPSPAYVFIIHFIICSFPLSYYNIKKIHLFGVTLFLIIKIVLHTSMCYLTYLEHNSVFYKFIRSSALSNCHHSTEYLATAEWTKKRNMFWLEYCNVCGYICYFKQNSKVRLHEFNMDVQGKYREKCERMAKSFSHLIIPSVKLCPKTTLLSRLVIVQFSRPL